MIKLRVDDYPGTKPDEFWKHNYQNFKSFHDIIVTKFKTYRLGVIPCHVSYKDLEHLGALREIEIALHGVNHDEKFPNEFREYQTQNDIEHAVHRSLNHITQSSRKIVKSYIPPHNVIDYKTINALKNCLITDIHTGPGTEMSEMIYAEGAGLKVHDSRSPLHYGRTDEMMERGCFPFLNEQIGDFYITLHWTWEFNIGLDSLKEFISKLEIR